MLNREVFTQLFPKSAASVDVYLPIVQAVTHANTIDTPRRLAASCGVALRFAREDEPQVQRSADALAVPVDLVNEDRPLLEGPCGGACAPPKERT